MMSFLVFSFISGHVAGSRKFIKSSDVLEIGRSLTFFFSFCISVSFGVVKSFVETVKSGTVDSQVVYRFSADLISSFF